MLKITAMDEFLGFGDSHTWRNAKLSRQNAKTGRQNEMP
jgi:hypothetical protein